MKHIRHIITSTAFTGELEFRYDALGLCFFEDRADLNPQQKDHFFKHFPSNVEQLQNLLKSSKTLTLTRIAIKMEFSLFWEAYGYKVGKKARAEKIWNTLNDADRVKAIEYIKPYDRWLSTKNNLEKVYPETYLSQNRWENVLPK